MVYMLLGTSKKPVLPLKIFCKPERVENQQLKYNYGAWHRNDSFLVGVSKCSQEAICCPWYKIYHNLVLWDFFFFFFWSVLSLRINLQICISGLSQNWILSLLIFLVFFKQNTNFILIFITAPGFSKNSKVRNVGLAFRVVYSQFMFLFLVAVDKIIKTVF